MHNRRILSLVVVLLVVLVAASGCRKTIPVESYSAAVKVQDVSADKVKNSIIRAGASLGWVILPVAENRLEGTLNVRAHQLVVNIDYSNTSYMISYKSSTNLSYKDGKIHPQYRNWVLNLQQHIDVELTTVNAQ